jgi:hypothetical protein
MATNRYIRPIQVAPISQYVDNSLAFNELSQTADLRQARIDKGVETAGEVTALINAVEYDPNDAERAAEVQSKYKAGIDEILNSGIDPGSTEFSRKVIDLQNAFATDTEVRALKFNATEQAKYDAFVAENPNAFIPKHIRDQFTTPNQKDQKGNVKIRRFEGGLPDPDLDADLTEKFSKVKANIREYEVGNPDDKVSFRYTADGRVVTVVNDIVQEKGNAWQIGQELEAQISRLLDPRTTDQAGQWLQGQMANKGWTKQDVLEYITNKAGAQMFSEEALDQGNVSTSGSSGGSGTSNATVLDPNNVTVVDNISTPTTFPSDFYETDNDGELQFDDNGNVQTVGQEDPELAYQTLTTNIEKSYGEFQDNPSMVMGAFLDGKTPDERQKQTTAINKWVNENLEDFDAPIASTQDGSKVFRTIEEITDDNLVRSDDYNSLFKLLKDMNPDTDESVIHDQIVAMNDRIHTLNSEIAVRNQIAYNAEQAVFDEVPNPEIETFSDDDKAVYNEQKFKEEAVVLNNKTMNEMVKGIELYEGFPEEFHTVNTEPENSFLTMREVNSTFKDGNGNSITMGYALNQLQGIDFTQDFTGGRGKDAKRWAFEKINKLGFNNPKELIEAMRKATWTQPAKHVVTNSGNVILADPEQKHLVFEDVRERAANNRKGANKEKLQTDMEGVKSKLLRDHIEARKGTDLHVFSTLNGFDPNSTDISFINDTKLSTLGRMEAGMARHYGLGRSGEGENEVFRKMLKTGNITMTNGQAINLDEDFYEELLGTDATTEELNKKPKAGEAPEYSNRAGGIEHLGMTYDPNTGQYKGVGFLVNRFGHPVLKDGEAIQVLYDNQDKSFSQTINDMLGASGGEANFARMLDMQADIETEPGKSTVTFTNDALLPGVNATFHRRVEGGKSLYNVAWDIPEMQQRQLVESLQNRYPGETITREKAEQLLGFKFKGSIQSASKSKLGQDLVGLHGALHAMQTQTLASEKGTILPDELNTFEPANLETLGTVDGHNRIRVAQENFGAEDFPVINAAVSDHVQNLLSTLGPIVLTSAARTTAGNQAADGSATSLHPQGLAMDLRTDPNRLTTVEGRAVDKYRSLANSPNLWSEFGIKYMEDEGDHIHIEFLDPNQ